MRSTRVYKVSNVHQVRLRCPHGPSQWSQGRNVLGWWPTDSSFSPRPPIISVCFFSWGLLVDLWWCLKAMNHPGAVGLLLGHLMRAPVAGLVAAGVSHDDPREAQTSIFGGSWSGDTTHPLENPKRRKNTGRWGYKARKLERWSEGLSSENKSLVEVVNTSSASKHFETLANINSQLATWFSMRRVSCLRSTLFFATSACERCTNGKFLELLPWCNFKRRFCSPDRRRSTGPQGPEGRQRPTRSTTSTRCTRSARSAGNCGPCAQVV